MEKKHISQMILHNRVLLIAVILLTLTVAGIIIGLSLPEHKPTIQGQLDTTDYRVSTKVPSRVVRLCVKEGDRVHRGDTIVILSAPEVNALESEAKSKHAVTVANDELVREGTRRELISSSYDRYQQAVAHADICEKTYRRVEALFNQGVASAQKRDEAKAAYDAAVAAAKALKQEYDMAVNGARREEKAATAAAARGAAAKVEEVKALVGETVLTAPMDGVVTEVFVEPGEFVGIGAPIINVETEESWFTFYVTEDKLQNFDYGTVVNVYRPASGDTVAARITRINNAGDFAAWKATRALEDLDLKVFDIRATPIKKIQHPHDGESAVLLTQE
jgi:HlyD family secretion protein